MLMMTPLMISPRFVLGPLPDRQDRSPGRIRVNMPFSRFLLTWADRVNMGAGKNIQPNPDFGGTNGFRMAAGLDVNVGRVGGFTINPAAC